MGDALRAGEQAVGELLRLEMGVAFDVLEPVRGVAGGVLDLEHFDRARLLIGLEHIEHVGFCLAARGLQAIGELDGVFQSELGAGADREVRGVSGVAHQHDRDAPVVVHPGLAHDPRELEPLRRAAQVSGVRHQLVAVEVFGEQVLAEGDRFLGAHPAEAGLEPHVLRGFDDEGRGVAVELVGVRLEPAVVGLLEGEGEGVEQLARSKPDEPALADLDVGLEGSGVFVADEAVDAVGGDDQIGVESLFVAHLLLEHELDAERLAARLQDVKKMLAADAGKAMAARGDGAALEVDVDVVPTAERTGDLLVGLRVRRTQITERLIGEHDAPAESVVRPVPLQYADVVGRIALLHQQGQVEPRRTAADAGYSHAPRPAPWSPLTLGEIV